MFQSLHRVIAHFTEIPAVDMCPAMGTFAELIKNSLRSSENTLCMRRPRERFVHMKGAPSAVSEGKRRIRFRNFQVSIKIRATRKPRALENKEQNGFFFYLSGAGYKWLFRMNFNVLRTDPINYSLNSARSSAANCFME